MTENCKFRRAILCAFYNISQRNFGILLILWCSFKLWWNFCLDQNLVYNANGPLANYAFPEKQDKLLLISHPNLTKIFVIIRLIDFELSPDRQTQNIRQMRIWKRNVLAEVMTICRMLREVRSIGELSVKKDLMHVVSLWKPCSQLVNKTCSHFALLPSCWQVWNKLLSSCIKVLFQTCHNNQGRFFILGLRRFLGPWTLWGPGRAVWIPRWNREQKTV